MSYEQELSELRETLGYVDLILLDVLARRAWLVRQIQKVKRAGGRPGRDSNQEEVVFSRLVMYREAGSSYPDEVVRKVFADLMAASEQLDEGANS
jgi:chorismate mutase